MEEVELLDVNRKNEIGKVGIPSKFEEVTVGEAIDRLGFGLFQVQLIFFCGVVFMTEACEVVLLSLLMPVLKENWNLSNFEEGLIGSCVFTGMLLGSTCLGYMSDKIGRKFTIIISASITAIFGLLSSVCFNYWLFVICRFIVGFSVGGSGVPYSLFTEYLPTKTRGKWLLLINCFWTLGTCFETGIGWLLLSNDKYFHGVSWNIYVAVSMTPLFLMFVLIPLVPESLRFLAISGEKEQIEKVIRRIERLNFKKILPPKNWNRNDQKGTQKFVKISMNIKKKEKAKISSLFRRSVIFVFLNTCLLYMGGSFAYYGVTMNTPDFFKTQKEKYIGSFVSSFAEFGGVIIPIFFMSCCGRKKMLAFLFFVSGVGLVCLSFPIDSLYLRLFFSLFLRGACLSAYCLVIIIAQESFPTNIRSLGCGLACSMGKIATATSPLIAKAFPWEDHLIPKIVFYYVAFGSVVLSLIHPFETSNRQLEDVPLVRKDSDVGGEGKGQGGRVEEEKMNENGSKGEENGIDLLRRRTSGTEEIGELELEELGDENVVLEEKQIEVTFIKENEKKISSEINMFNDE